jgi:hypothetical protein
VPVGAALVRVDKGGRGGSDSASSPLGLSGRPPALEHSLGAAKEFKSPADRAAYLAKFNK